MSSNETCKWLTSLATANPIRVRECPCGPCRFSTEVSDLEETMIDPVTGELYEGWEYHDLEQD
jgi:hypothetical protein